MNNNYPRDDLVLVVILRGSNTAIHLLK